MAIYPLDRIAKDVRIALDRNKTSNALTDLGDVDTLSLEDIIKSKIIEAVKRVHSEAPVYLLDGGNDFSSELYWRGDNSGWMLLPDDFMRLVVFEMSDWERVVFRAIGTDDPEYAMQRSRFKGIRGTAQKPVCAVSIRPEGRVLEFYSCKSEEAEVVRAVYLPYPKIDENGGVAICGKCYESVIYMAAALVLTALGETDKSQLFIELSKQSLI
ncbi:MAG: hypothetical protein IJY31_00185 [Muribaculaceae bacterium]|nr:hypothetical protein [Muribaculaceae bacterium]